MRELFKGYNAVVVNHIFQMLLVTYLLLLLIEQIWTGSVSYYLNLNYLLIAVIIFGILDVFSEHKQISEKKTDWKDYLFIILLGITGAIIIKIKTAQLNWLSWLVSIIAGILIILLSLLILEEDEKESRFEELEKEDRKEIGRRQLMRITLGIIAVLFIISLAINIFSSLTFLESLRIVFGSIYVLFLPGFIISFIFFKNKAIDWIERIALSFALSIAVVPLAVFYLNLIGVKINLVNSSLTILGIILISIFILYIKGKNKEKI